jgi:transposase
VGPPRCNADLLDDPDRLGEQYRSSTSVQALADSIGVSSSTVRRALIRHGIERLPRNRNRRGGAAHVLDDPDRLARRYETHSAVDIAAELGVSPRTVYSVMDRHGIVWRTEPGVLKLRRPELADDSWLHDAVERGSSRMVAAELEVSAGTLTTAYQRAGIEPAHTSKFYMRGRTMERPSAHELRAAWEVDGTFRGVGRRFGVTHTTAAVWLAEIGVFADTTPVLSRRVLLDAIELSWPMSLTAEECAVSATTVRIELHRHGLFDAHRLGHRGSRTR